VTTARTGNAHRRALLAEFVEIFGPMQNLVVEKPASDSARATTKRGQTCSGQCLGRESQSPKFKVLKCRIGKRIVSLCSKRILDDVSGEILGHFVEVALAAGALDVFHTPSR